MYSAPILTLRFPAGWACQTPPPLQAGIRCEFFAAAPEHSQIPDFDQAVSGDDFSFFVKRGVTWARGWCLAVRIHFVLGSPPKSVISRYAEPKPKIKRCTLTKTNLAITTGGSIAGVAIEILEMHGKRAAHGVGWIVKQDRFLVLLPVTVP